MKQHINVVTTAMVELKDKQKSVTGDNIREVIRCLKTVCKDPVVFSALIGYLKNNKVT